ncbi:MAG TPA: peptide ABC transporter permease [Spirochaetaceae bacterium]|nr:peptide ABC transporter permease [Spirochaetaceae bacterium]
MSGFYRECVKMAVHTMKSNKLRTALSVLGVLIGVSALVVILSLGDSATKNIMSAFSEGGIDIITIRPQRSRNAREILNDEFASELKGRFDSIDDCIVTNSQSCSVRYLSEVSTGMVIGTYSAMSDFYSLKFDSGKWWDLEDNINSRLVCAIGSQIAENLFNGIDPVGEKIKIFYRNTAGIFTVTGVVSEVDSTASIDFDNSIFIPFNTFSSKIRRSAIVDSYIVRIKEGFDPSVESEKIEEYMSSLVSTDGFSMFSLSSLREMISKSMGTITMFIALIGGISLLVGGIGIMNIMLVSVAERTKEIGILKAIGAQPRNIEVQFLIEAVFLTLFGGSLGIALGVVLALLVAYVLVWPLSVSLLSVFAGLLFSVLVGVFFGVYPARKASRLNPIDALSRD